jgi:hypothetical protein
MTRWDILIQGLSEPCDRERMISGVCRLTEETEYMCPECGVDLPANAAQCPGCGLEFASDDDEGPSVPDEGHEAACEGAGDEEPVEVGATQEELSEGATGDEAADEAPTEEPTLPASTGPSRKGFLGGLLDPVGLTFLVLTFLAVVGTVVLMHWDVWVQGASAESVGDRQRLLVYMGVLGVVVCAIVTVVDIMRHRT